MERRTGELDQFLKSRRSATDAAAVVFENSPSRNLADAVSTDESCAVPKSPKDNTKEVRDFWKRQISDATLVPLPLHNGAGSGVTGMALTQASFSAAAIQRPSNVQFPLTASTQLTYHGVKYQPKGGKAMTKDSRSKSGGFTENPSVAESYGSFETAPEPLDAPEGAPPDLAQAEDDGDGHAAAGTDSTGVPSSPLAAENACSAMTSTSIPQSLDAVGKDGCASAAVVALLRAADFALAAGNSSDVTSKRASRPTKRPISLPKSALITLLRQFAAIRTKGRVDLSDVVSGFRACQSSVRRQASMRRRESVSHVEGRFSAMVGDADRKVMLTDGCGVPPEGIEVDSTSDSECIKKLFYGSSGSSADMGVIDLTAGGAELLETLREECNALRQKFHLEDQASGQLMICDGRIDPSAAQHNPCPPELPSEATMMDVGEIDDGLDAPMPVPPKVPFLFGPISQPGFRRHDEATTPIDAVERAVQVVNVVPLPAALHSGLGNMGVMAEDDGDNIDTEDGLSEGEQSVEPTGMCDSCNTLVANCSEKDDGRAEGANDAESAPVKTKAPQGPVTGTLDDLAIFFTDAGNENTDQADSSESASQNENSQAAQQHERPTAENSKSNERADEGTGEQDGHPQRETTVAYPTENDVANSGVQAEQGALEEGGCEAGGVTTAFEQIGDVTAGSEKRPSSPSTEATRMVDEGDTTGGLKHVSANIMPQGCVPLEDVKPEVPQRGAAEIRAPPTVPARRRSKFRLACLRTTNTLE